MKKPDITKGEWTHNFTLIEGDDDVIAICDYVKMAERVANAMAISAVPEMIDALSSAIDELESIQEYEPFVDPDVINECKQALIKAGVEL